MNVPYKTDFLWFREWLGVKYAPTECLSMKRVFGFRHEDILVSVVFDGIQSLIYDIDLAVV